MKSFVLLIATLLLVFITGITDLNAQAPEGINYQAVARNSDGDIMANQDMTVRLGIYTDLSATDKVYEESQEIKTNDYGLFAIVIGEGNVLEGNFADIQWEEKAHFLKVEVDNGTGYIDMGTIAFQSVPYSLHAKSAGTVSDLNIHELTDVSINGLNAGHILKWNGVSWVPSEDEGLLTVVSDATLSGAGNVNMPLSIAQQGADTGDILKWNGSTWLPVPDLPDSSGGIYLPGNGININGNIIHNTKPDRLVTITGQGSTTVSGGYPNFTVTSTDSNTTYTAGNGLDLIGTTFNATNLASIWNANQLHGNTVSNATPVENDVLKWNGSKWVPMPDSITRDSSHWDKMNHYVYLTEDSVGIGVEEPVAKLHVQDSADVLFGDTSTMSAPPTFHWMARKGALRVGKRTFTNWDMDSVGDYSVSFGINNRAKGNNAIAIGAQALASNYTSVAIGTDVTSSAFASVALGDGNTASGYASFAAGSFSHANAAYATAMGLNAQAMGIQSIALGTNTLAEGDTSLAMGGGTNASGPYATAMGRTTSASGNSSTALGRSTTAIGDYSLSGGAFSAAVGPNTLAIGKNAFASGEHAVALGNDARAEGDFSFAAGSNTTASGYGSIGIGVDNSSSGGTSVAIGFRNSASGLNSIAIGEGLESFSASEVVVGSYNTLYTPNSVNDYDPDDRIFVIGNSYTPADRSDAMVVLKNGNTGIGISDPGHKLAVEVTSNAVPDGDGIALVNTESGNYWNLHMTDQYLRFSQNNNNVSYINNVTGAYVQVSDRRLKSNIRPYESILDRIQKLEVKRYHYKHDPAKHSTLGLIAQDVLPHFPELVNRDEDSEYYGLNYSGLSVVAIKAIQELTQEVEQLKKEKQDLAEIERENRALKERLAELEAKVKEQEQFESRLAEIENQLKSVEK